MSLCDPNRNRPVPSTGERPFNWICEFCFRTSTENVLPGDWRLMLQSAVCPSCHEKVINSPGGYYSVKGGAFANGKADPRHDLSAGGRTLPKTEQLPGQPKFNSLHISHLALKVDGKTEHLFVAILNGEAVGQVLAIKQEWGACGLRMLFVSPKHRHMGIGTRLVSRALVFAHNEKCKEVEIAVHKGNNEGRLFWIRRRFIYDDTRDMSATPEYRCMVKPL